MGLPWDAMILDRGDGITALPKGTQAVGGSHSPGLPYAWESFITAGICAKGRTQVALKGQQGAQLPNGKIVIIVSGMIFAGSFHLDLNRHEG